MKSFYILYYNIYLSIYLCKNTIFKINQSCDIISCDLTPEKQSFDEYVQFISDQYDP